MAAIPIGTAEGCEDLMRDADDVVCLYLPEPFSSVGTHYGDFQAPTDEAVQSILQGFHASPEESQLRTTAMDQANS